MAEAVMADAVARGGRGGRIRLDVAERSRLRWWLLQWVVLPNLGFCLLWIVGAPPRGVDILLFGGVGLVVRTMRRPVRLLAFSLLLGWSFVSTICYLFFLSIQSFAASLFLFFELTPTGSVEYLVIGLVIAAVLTATIWASERDGGFRSIAALGLAMAGVLGLAAVDTAVTWSGAGAYRRPATADTPFASGIGRSGLVTGAVPGRHLMLVAVEALGQPTDADTRAMLRAPWEDPRVRARYTVTTGTSPFHGSTTNAEMRELCGRWDEFLNMLDGPQPHCLPAQLSARGYRTTAVHSFTGTMFSRARWYPNIGFDRMLFREELEAAGARHCTGVFQGACDRDVPPQLARELKGATMPTFLYWLTVNSHIPVPPKPDLGVDRCEEFSPTLARNYAMSCRVLKIYDDVARSLAQAVTAADFPATDILIVGDHAPPFFDRWNRSKFSATEVPWILLRAKEPTSVRR